MLRAFNAELRSANLAESASLNERSAWEIFAALRRVLQDTFGSAARVDVGPLPGNALTLPVSSADLPDVAGEGFTEAPSVLKTTGDELVVSSTSIGFRQDTNTFLLRVNKGDTTPEDTRRRIPLPPGGCGLKRCPSGFFLNSRCFCESADTEDCPDGFSLVAGVCVEDAPFECQSPLFACYAGGVTKCCECTITGGQCDAGYRCVNGECQEIPEEEDCCDDGVDCPTGYECNDDCDCVEETGGDQCTANTDCECTESCVNGVCVDFTGQGKCKTAADCNTGGTCSPNCNCVYGPGGGNPCDPECDPGFVCRNGQCVDEDETYGCGGTGECQHWEECVNDTCVDSCTAQTGCSDSYYSPLLNACCKCPGHSSDLCENDPQVGCYLRCGVGAGCSGPTFGYYQCFTTYWNALDCSCTGTFLNEGNCSEIVECSPP